MENLLSGVQHLQNIHPLVVHFPIAFLSGAVLCYLIAYFGHNKTVEWVAFVLLVAGTISAGVAVATGLYAEDGVILSQSVRDNLLELHENLMIILFCLSLLLSIWGILKRPFPEKGRVLFIGLLIVMALLLAKGADYGGRLVFEYNAGGSACSQPIELR